MRFIAILLSSAFIVTACEQTPPPLIVMNSPDPSAFLLSVPDEGFRLSSADRERLPPGVDPDALERLLARVRPEHRAEILTDFTELGSHGPVAFGPITTNVPDPEFKAALAAVIRRPVPDRGSPP